MIYLYSRIARIFQSRYLFYGYENKIRNIYASAMTGTIVLIWMIGLASIPYLKLLTQTNNLVFISTLFIAVFVGFSRTDYVKKRTAMLLNGRVVSMYYDVFFVLLTSAAIAVLIKQNI